MSQEDKESRLSNGFDPVDGFMFGNRRFEGDNEEKEGHNNYRRGFDPLFQPFTRHAKAPQDSPFGRNPSGRQRYKSSKTSEIEKILNQVDYELLIETVDTCVTFYEQVKPVVFPYLQELLNKIKSEE